MKLETPTYLWYPSDTGDKSFDRFAEVLQMRLSKSQTIFLKALRQALEGLPFSDAIGPQFLTRDDYAALFHLAKNHNVLPMIYEAVSKREDYATLPEKWKKSLRQTVIMTVTGQVRRSQEFLWLYQNFIEHNLDALVVKGIVLRKMYPHPDDRVSQDEDLYVLRPLFADAADVLQNSGLVPLLDTSGFPSSVKGPDGRLSFAELLNMDSDRKLPYEITFYDPKSGLKIELHQSLFAGNDAAYKGMNECFQNSFENEITEMTGGVKLHTLSYTDHMLFLILHAYKHFLSGGFGIRQVCDLCMLANIHGKEMNWEDIFKKTSTFHVEKFAASLFALGEKYLNFNPENAAYPEYWKETAEDPEDLLGDILKAGIFGFSDMNRKHSSNITLHKVEAVRGGRIRSGNNMEKLRTVFPGEEEMEARYSYLRRFPALLPVAWFQRISVYLNHHRGAARDAAETLKIGDERVRLLEEYGILPYREEKSLKRLIPHHFYKRVEKKFHKPAAYDKNFARKRHAGKRKMHAPVWKMKQGKNTAESFESGNPGMESSNVRRISTQRYISMLRELTQEGKEVSLLISGSSMAPFLVGNRDTVFFRKPDRPLRRGDIVFYQRRTGQYVMHRIQKVIRYKDGRCTFNLIGDGQFLIERDIQREQIFAIVTAAERKGKVVQAGDFWWEFFANVWIRMIPLRLPIMKGYQIFRKIL